MSKVSSKLDPINQKALPLENERFEDLFQYEVLKRPEDADQMAQASAISFDKHNPFCKLLGITAEQQYDSLRDALTTTGIQDGLTVICRHKPTDKIVSGVFTLDTRSHYPYEIDEDYSPLFLHWMNFLDDLKKRGPLKSAYQTFGVPVAWCDFIYVSDEFLGYGLGKKQTVMTLHHMRARGYGAYYCQVTSPIQGRIMSEVSDNEAKLHSDSIVYSEYVGYDGSRPFKAVPGDCEGLYRSTHLSPKLALWATAQGIAQYKGLQTAKRFYSVSATKVSYSAGSITIRRLLTSLMTKI